MIDRWLDFVPVPTEHYYLILRTEMLEHPTVRDLLAFLCGAEFKQLIASLPGYAADGAGEIATIQKTLPWEGARGPRSEPADLGPSPGRSTRHGRLSPIDCSEGHTWPPT